MSRPKSMDAIDIIVVNYRSSSLTLQTVARLRPWSQGRIHVVDNSEEASEVQALMRGLGLDGGLERRVAPGIERGLGRRFEAADVALHVMPRNGGFAAACNHAWQASSARLVLLLNPDALIDAATVLGLADVLQQQPQWAAVSPRTWWDQIGGFLLPLPAAQDPMSRCVRSWGSRIGARWWAERAARQAANALGSGDVLKLKCLAGAVLMLRREAVEQAGGLFDERYFMYFEDAELSLRLRRQGWQLGLSTRHDAVHTWQHQAHKAPLMTRAEQSYLQQHHPWFARLSDHWPQLRATGHLGPALIHCSNATEARQALGPVRAYSPSATGDPAIVRLGLKAALFSDDEWDLMAPGSYWAWTEQAWLGFEKL